MSPVLFIFRAVMEDELRDLQQLRVFRNPPGIENKYFTLTAEDAAAYARKAYMKMGDTSPYTLVRTGALDHLVPSAHVDGQIRAILISTSELEQLVPEILDYAPLRA